MFSEIFGLLASLDTGNNKNVTQKFRDGLKNSNRIKSISAYSSNSIFYFPEIVSDQLTPEEVAMVSRMNERANASFVVACVSLMPFHKVQSDDKASVEAYLAQFHQNLGVSSGSTMRSIASMVESTDETIACADFLLECWIQSKKDHSNFIDIIKETVPLNEMFNIDPVDPVTRVLQERYLGIQEELDTWGFLGEASASDEDDYTLEDLLADEDNDFDDDDDDYDPEDLEDDDDFIDEAAMLKKRDSLPDSSFGIPSKRAFPIHDKKHVVQAIRMFGHAEESDHESLAKRIFAAADTFKVNVKVGKGNPLFKFTPDKYKKVKGMNENVEKIKSSMDNIKFTLEAVSDNKILSAKNLTKLSSLESKLNKLKNKYVSYLNRYKKKYNENKKTGSKSKLIIRFNKNTIDNPKAFMIQYGSYIKTINKKLKLVEKRRTELRRRKGITESVDDVNVLLELTDMDLEAVDYCISLIDESLNAPDSEVFEIIDESAALSSGDTLPFCMQGSTDGKSGKDHNDAKYNGDYDKIHTALLKRIDNTELKEFQALMVDAHLGIETCKVMSSNMENLEKGKSDDAYYKKLKAYGMTSKKIEKHMTWLKNKYIPTINKKWFNAKASKSPWTKTSDLYESADDILDEAFVIDYLKDVNREVKAGLDNLTTDVRLSGDYEKIHPRLMGLIDNAKTIDRLRAVRNDADIGLRQLDKLAKNFEDYENGNPSKYVDKKFMEKCIKHGMTVDKIRKHQKWITEVYKPAISKKMDELRKSVNEAAGDKVYDNPEDKLKDYISSGEKLFAEKNAALKDTQKELSEYKKVVSQTATKGKDDPKRGSTKNIRTFDREVFSNMDVKKANDAVPTFTKATIGFIVDGTNEITNRDILIGIKSYVHKAPSLDLVNDIYNCIINKRKFLRFVKFVTGEERSLSDLLFGIKELRADALEAKGNNEWRSAFKRRRRWSKISVPYLMKEYTPNGTVVITMNEVNYIKDQYGVDIMKLDHVKMVMDVDFLLSFIVVDQANEMVYVIYDGHDNFQQYTYAMLEREQQTSDRTMRELYRSFSR